MNNLDGLECLLSISGALAIGSHLFFKAIFHGHSHKDSGHGDDWGHAEENEGVEPS